MQKSRKLNVEKVPHMIFLLSCCTLFSFRLSRHLANACHKLRTYFTKQKKYYFTLLEVVLAIAILSLGFITAMSISMTASRRLIKAVSRWEEQHMLNQAAEYFLLAGPKEAIPQGFFPYEGYRAECIIDNADLPEEVDSEFGTWSIVKLKISIFNEDDKKVNSLEMNKIFRAEDIE